jgi:hypothetical protein
VTVRLRALAKTIAGTTVSALAPQCDFARAIFIIGHMRCGSTALSNVLVSRPEFSGYGEAHIAYEGQSALGVLLINQWRRRSWRPGAQYLFDKILHSRYDAAAGDAFFGARAIFLAREPDSAIRSIRTLFATLGSTEYGSDAAAADYYGERLSTMLGLWERFAPDRRLALSYAGVTADPEAALAAVSALAGINPPLTNRYEARAASVAPGAGDPLRSGRFQRIEPATRATSLAGTRPPLALAPERRQDLRSLFARFDALTAPVGP